MEALIKDESLFVYRITTLDGEPFEYVSLHTDENNIHFASNYVLSECKVNYFGFRVRV